MNVDELRNPGRQNGEEPPAALFLLARARAACRKTSAGPIGESYSLRLLLGFTFLAGGFFLAVSGATGVGASLSTFGELFGGTEGSSLGRIGGSEGFPTEETLERMFIERFKTTPGIVLVACSAQNIDRVVTIYRAAKQTKRTLIVDAYAAEILKATGYDSIPKPVRGWPNLAVFIPQAQRGHLVRKNIASIVDSYRGFRLWPEQLVEHAPRSVMLFRGWMLRDLERARALGGARVIWSQWDGYLKEGSGAQLKAECEARGIPFEIIHTSGHASLGDLKRLAAAVHPKALIPVHTFEPERFPELFENVVLRQDGEWWDV
jgi:ribonuclease J